MSEQENKPEVAKVEKPTRLVQNGVTRPLDGTLCGKAWTIADNMSELKGSPVAVADLLVETDKVGLNPANVKAEYSRWRKFHGISGRIESEASLKKKAEREEAKLAKAKEREEAKAKREAEKAAKAAEREAKKAEREEAKKQKAAERAAKAAEKEAEKKAKAEAAAQAKADEASTDEAGEE